ncbi:MAG TPA: SET domain-containing protein-lysine N-methyltransferase [Candidatus Acidoferrales bacterium]|nr:SET domain-containing protein-lysine N-methyltransferase [Candidatus Acidoferrales bacterium]
MGRTAKAGGSIPAIDPRYALFRLRVGRSRVHRFGVFALEPIPKGKKVIEYTGERISRAETTRRLLRVCRQRRNRRFYLVRLNPYWAIDGERGGSGAELINHSCEPNMLLVNIRNHAFCVTRRRIRKGEELAYDYAFPSDAFRVPCRCGARACRGTINVREASR